MVSFLIPTATFTLLLFLLSPAATVVTGFIYDVDGNVVTNPSGSYYMVPYPTRPGEGPIGWKNKTSSCPLYVTTTAFTEFSRKSTITISQIHRARFLISGFYPTTIKFNDKNTPCGSPLLWFGKPKGSIYGLDVVAGTVIHDFKEKFVFLGDFVIEDANVEEKFVYQLKYCMYEDENGMQCYPVVYNPENSDILEINLDPLLFPKRLQFQLHQKVDPSLKMKMKM